MPRLTIDGLRVSYRSRRGELRAVDGVSLEVRDSECLGLVGESGCGKSTLASAVLRTLPDNASICAGRIQYGDRDIGSLSSGDLRQIRWRHISFVPQAAMNALDPVYRVKDQVLESITAHERVTRRDTALARIAELFRLVQLDPERMDDYPHQLSGGMRQRAIIAMALTLAPSMIIADEPTTSLDVLVQEQILRRMREIRRQSGTSMLLITHNMGAVAENCDRVGVMYAGKLMEIGPLGEVLKRPAMPYTMGLVNAFPSLRDKQDDLISIPGSPPDLEAPPKGCRFNERCPFAMPVCDELEPALSEVDPHHAAACHLRADAGRLRALAARTETWTRANGRAARVPAAAPTPATDGAVLEVRQLRKVFPVRERVLHRLLRRSTPRELKAVDGIDLVIRRGEIVGLAGESGCGKTTTGMVVLRLDQPTAGEIRFEGHDIARVGTRELLRFRRHAQMVFQDPYESLDPRFTVAHTLEEPLKIHKMGTRAERAERIHRTLELVELRPADDYLGRFPHQLSGGQRQRVAIARAVILEPKLVIADEPVSMLDVSVRAGILKLLRRLSSEMAISFLYISHDLSTMRQICHTIAIMYLGRIVEVGPSERVLCDPGHPYTQALIAAVPLPDPDAPRRPLEIRGDVPSPIDLPPGCRFASRCPRVARRCETDDPALRPMGPEHRVACHV